MSSMPATPIAAVDAIALRPSSGHAVESQQGTALLDMAAMARGSGGATLTTEPAPAELAPAAMSLTSLATQFKDGMHNGFYTDDVNRLVERLQQMNTPGSSVAIGDVAMELIHVQAKVGIAEAFSKVSSKLSEGLQTLVVRQT